MRHIDQYRMPGRYLCIFERDFRAYIRYVLSLSCNAILAEAYAHGILQIIIYMFGVVGSAILYGVRKCL